METRESERISKMAMAMLDERHTCRDCTFKICPALQVFAGSLKEISLDLAMREDRSDKAVFALMQGLNKIMMATEKSATDTTQFGYVYRVASNATKEYRRIMKLGEFSDANRTNAGTEAGDTSSSDVSADLCTA